MSPYGVIRPWVNPYGAEAAIFKDTHINSMAADALAPHLT